MGELIDFAAFKKRKEDEAHEAEMEEIRALQAEVSAYLDEMEDLTTGPFISQEERDSWSKRAIEILSSSLGMYRFNPWPIDSSDL